MVEGWQETNALRLLLDFPANMHHAPHSHKALNMFSKYILWAPSQSRNHDGIN